VASRLAGLLAALCLAPTGAAIAEEARGVVFDDRDGDGRRDAGEPGLPGVAVSNGIDVTATDADGRWTLPAPDEAIFFVTKPTGWMTPVNGRMLPRFHYVHQPKGSPKGLRYAGIEPTGPLPPSIDFPLRKVDEPRRFEAILFADPQPQTSEEVDFIRDDVVAELIGTTARFGMTMGDIMFDDLSLFPRYNSVVARIGIPWYNVPGNHELNLLAPNDEYSLETFKRIFGPPYYSFDVGLVHFVVLDNIEYKGEGDTSDPANLRGNGGYVGRIGKRQLRWLERDLARVPEDRLVFVAMHAPLKAFGTDHEASNTADRKKLFALLEGRPNLYTVAGHTHTTEHHYFGEADGFDGPGELHHHVLATVSGSWWSGPIDDRGIAVADQRDGTPNGYHVLEIDGTDASVRFKAARFPERHQMRVVLDVAHHRFRDEALRDFRPGAHLDGRLSVDEVAAASVVVNLFDGGPRSQVSFWIDDGEPIALERVAQPDPAVHELYLRNRDAVKSWVQAVPSSHLFVGDLPDTLGPGTYLLTVRAVDEFGRVHHAHQVLEVEGSSAVPDDEVVYPFRSSARGEEQE
jgi:hypothetical protein